MARLENWTLITRTDINGETYQKLLGDVYGHPRANKKSTNLCDGHNVLTSKLVSFDLESGIAVTQSGTVYKLGVKSPLEGL